MKNQRIRITYRQREIYDFIRTFIKEKGVAPTIQEIADNIGFKSKRAVTYHLKVLENLNIIKRDSSKRGIGIPQDISELKSEKTVLIPLVGRAPCGSPVWAEQNIEDYYPISQKIVEGKSGLFFVKAFGDSLNKAGVNEGDLILFQKQENAENGDIIAALINNEITIKIFQREGNFVFLQPNSNNPKHKPIILDSDFKIQGKMLHVMRGLNTTERLVPG